MIDRAIQSGSYNATALLYEYLSNLEFGCSVCLTWS